MKNFFKKSFHRSDAIMVEFRREIQKSNLFLSFFPCSLAFKKGIDSTSILFEGVLFGRLILSDSIPTLDFFNYFWSKLIFYFLAKRGYLFDSVNFWCPNLDYLFKSRVKFPRNNFDSFLHEVFWKTVSCATTSSSDIRQIYRELQITLSLSTHFSPLIIFSIYLHQ